MILNTTQQCSHNEWCFLDGQDYEHNWNDPRQVFVLNQKWQETKIYLILLVLARKFENPNDDHRNPSQAKEVVIICFIEISICDQQRNDNAVGDLN